MKVWVVTEEAFSNEGLEGAFDVFVGVAASQLDALALIEKTAPAKFTHEARFVIGQGSGSASIYTSQDEQWERDHAVTLEEKHYRHEFRKVAGVMRQMPVDGDEGYWSHHTTWHVLEVEVSSASTPVGSAAAPDA